MFSPVHHMGGDAPEAGWEHLCDLKSPDVFTLCVFLIMLYSETMQNNVNNE